jgi:Cys-rich protein (TIGR01571 family)
MGVSEESKPLLEKKLVSAGEAQHQVAPPPRHLAVAVPELNGSERGWNGRLLQCFGSCDTTGVASAALVHSVPCVAFGHNVKRAFGKSFWKHTLVFALLFSVWGYAYLGASFRVGIACGPDFPPHHPGPHDEPYPGVKATQHELLPGATLDGDLVDDDLVEKPILSGATLDEDLLLQASLEDSSAIVATQADVSSSVPTELEESTSVPTELEESTTFPAQLALPEGRKLLHKHKHEEDDDDDDDDYFDEDHEHKHKHDKKIKQDAKKWLKELEKELNSHHDDHFNHNDDFHRHGPACREARRHLGMTWGVLVLSFLAGAVYAARMRTKIRSQFGIPGSRCGDLWTWLFCGACALCQETRTLWHNNVHEGLWFGPTLLAGPSSEQPFLAPVQQTATKVAPTKPDTLHVAAEDAV